MTAYKPAPWPIANYAGRMYMQPGPQAFQSKIACKHCRSIQIALTISCMRPVRASTMSEALRSSFGCLELDDVLGGFPVGLITDIAGKTSMACRCCQHQCHCAPDRLLPCRGVHCWKDATVPATPAGLSMAAGMGGVGGKLTVRLPLLDAAEVELEH